MKSRDITVQSHEMCTFPYIKVSHKDVHLMCLNPDKIKKNEDNKNDLDETEDDEYQFNDDKDSMIYDINDKLKK